MKGINGDPYNSGIAISPIDGTNTKVPPGWPSGVIFAPPGGPPGPPIQYGDSITNNSVEPGFGYLGTGDIDENLRYFFHSDHLGSTSYITDSKGDISQFIGYMPFGEAFVEQHSDYDSPYKFNGKVMDNETGLAFFGARFFDPKTSVWISVDPKAEASYGWSPYNYCYNNPIVFVDPDGKSGIPVIDKNNKTITVHSKFVFYGGAANTELSKKAASEIAAQYNGAVGKVLYDGVEYTVNFKITYETVSEDDAAKMANGNTDASINFVRVEKNNSRVGRSFYEVGGNSGFFNTDDNIGTSTTGPHEVLHGYGLNHSSGDQRGKGQPDMMAARGTLVDPKYQYDPKVNAGAVGGTINPAKRKISQQNILDMFKGVTFDKNGKGQIGTVTNKIYNVDGYEKH